MSSAIYVIVLILWVLTFQVLDIEITKANPQAPKDEARTGKFRALLFGSYLLALVLAFIIPFLTIVVIGLNVLLMGVLFVLSHKKDV